MEEERKVVILNIDDILPNRFQPRIQFNEQAINELAESIKLHGVIQPIVVRKISDKYEIIAGERRYKASVMAGKTTIPAIVTTLDDKNSAEVALIENVQRQDLTPIEEAISYKKILDMGYINQEELGAKLGKKQSTIANKLRLLNLSEEVQEALMENKISERHARSLLKLNENDQITMLNRIVNERLTVRKTDEEIAKLQETNGGSQKEIEKGENMNNDILRDFNIPTEPIINDEVKPVEPVQQTNEFKNVTEAAINVLPTDSTPVQPNSFEPVEANPFNTPVNEPINPGFMDIDKIEKTATDIYPEVKAPTIDLMAKPEPVQPVQEVKPVEEENVPQGGKFFNMFNFNAPEKEDNFIEDVEEGQVNMDFGETFNNSFNPVIEPVKPVEPVQDPIQPVEETKPAETKPVEPNPFGESVSFFEDIEEPVQKMPDLMAKPEPVEPIQEPNPFNEVKPTEPIQEEVPFNEPIQSFSLTDDGFSSNEQSVQQPAMSYEQPKVERPYMMSNDVQFDDEGEIEVKIPNYNEPTIKVDMKTIISTIRECAEKIEKFGYEVDTDEMDLNDVYEVTFRIKKGE